MFFFALALPNGGFCFSGGSPNHGFRYQNGSKWSDLDDFGVPPHFRKPSNDTRFSEKSSTHQSIPCCSRGIRLLALLMPAAPGPSSILVSPSWGLRDSISADRSTALSSFWDVLFHHGSLNVPIEHHPTIRYMVYNGYYKVMSNIPKMGQLPTPVHSFQKSWRRRKRSQILNLLECLKGRFP